MTGVAHDAQLAQLQMRKTPLNRKTPPLCSAASPFPYAATLAYVCLLWLCDLKTLFGSLTKRSIFLSIESCNHPLDFPVMVFCDLVFLFIGYDNHPLFLTGVDGILEFEFGDYRGSVAIILEGYFIGWLDG